MGKPARDLTGVWFGRWLVLGPVHQEDGGEKQWWVVCSCEKRTLKPIKMGRLVTGHSRSCGCLRADVATARVQTHGKSRTPEYNAWMNLKQRCLNPKNARYADYGGRGITVCDRWLESFENFLADMGEKPSKTSSVERVDNNGPYSPDNCVWLEKRLQPRNTRRTVFYTHNGETKPICVWAEVYGVNYRTLYNRLSLGFTFEDAISKELQWVKTVVEYNGESKSLRELEQVAGVPKDTIQRRINNGWSVKAATETPPAHDNHKKNIEYAGRVWSLRKLAAAHGLTKHCLAHRLYKLGWDLERALTTPSRKAAMGCVPGS